MAHRITNAALVFGGDQLTATDVAVAARMVNIGQVGHVRRLEADLLAWATDCFRRLVEEGVDRMKPGGATPAVSRGRRRLPRT